jgi:hypothetical protein
VVAVLGAPPYSMTNEDAQIVRAELAGDVDESMFEGPQWQPVAASHATEMSDGKVGGE